MDTRVSVDEAREHLDEMLCTVRDGKQPVTIERNGEAVAVVISREQFERFQEAAKRRFFEVVRELQRANEGEDPDEVMRIVTEEVEAVRRERRARGT